MKVKSTSAKVGDWVFVIICVLISIICVVPMINLLAKSLSSTEYLVKNAVSLWPKGFNLDAYKTVLSDPKYIRAFFWTVFLTSPKVIHGYRRGVRNRWFAVFAS